tara:strand:+ start:3618 stop:3875 length:258 start_codon:yes stop_codon:yes gene_type:complete
MKNNNKIIAEFMGHKPKKLLYVTLYRDYKDWNQLMPVIEKIQDLFVDNPELDWHLYDDIRYNVPYLDDTYNAVLYTIKQYNNGKQ